MASFVLKKLIPLTASMVFAIILVSYAHQREVISTREAGLLLVGLVVIIAFWVALISRKGARASQLITGTNERADPDRKKLMTWIRIGKITIAFFGVLRVLGLLQSGPLLPRIVGGIVNVCFIVAVAQIISRFQRRL